MQCQSAKKKKEKKKDTHRKITLNKVDRAVRRGMDIVTLSSVKGEDALSKRDRAERRLDAMGSTARAVRRQAERDEAFEFPVGSDDKSLAIIFGKPEVRRLQIHPNVDQGQAIKGR